MPATQLWNKRKAPGGSLTAQPSKRRAVGLGGMVGLWTPKTSAAEKDDNDGEESSEDPVDAVSTLVKRAIDKAVKKEREALIAEQDRAIEEAVKKEREAFGVERESLTTAMETARQEVRADLEAEHAQMTQAILSGTRVLQSQRDTQMASHKREMDAAADTIEELRFLLATRDTDILTQAAKLKAGRVKIKRARKAKKTKKKAIASLKAEIASSREDRNRRVHPAVNHESESQYFARVAQLDVRHGCRYRITPNKIPEPVWKSYWWFEKFQNDQAKNRTPWIHIIKIEETDLGVTLPAADRCESCKKRELQCSIYTQAGREDLPISLQGVIGRCGCCRFSGGGAGGCSFAKMTFEEWKKAPLIVKE